MQLISHIPAPPLDRFIEQICYFSMSGPAHLYERVLPSGRIQLVLNLEEDSIAVFEGLDPRTRRTMPGMLVAGPSSQCALIGTDCLRSILTVVFHPGGSFPFLRPPALEFRDRDTALEDVWNQESPRLRQRLLEAPLVNCKFRIIEELLAEHLRRGSPAHPAVEYAVAQLDCGGPGVSVAAVADRIGLSGRRFQQIFNEQVGLSPKLFYRVRRFQRLLRTVHKRADIDWAEVALDCGYYDQAHFNHDFREFSGLNPTAYSASNRLHHNHVPVEG
jgi:AraC-like DNA-binding protein